MVTIESVMVNAGDFAQHRSMIATPGAAADAPRKLAARPLFYPLAPFLGQFAGDGPGELEALNGLHDEIRPRSGGNASHVLRFVPPDRSPLTYEERIFQRGEVVTRARNWHDFFNALVWMRFAQTKAALNALHVELMRAGASNSGRGPVRDAATQFDESGVAVVSTDPVLLDLLRRRCWKELFWSRRADVVARMRFLVLGHGLYDALRAPFYRMCGRAALIEVDQAIIEGDLTGQCERVDGVLAARFTERHWYPKPKALMALPLLGIPGVARENERPEYYDDTLQFRPPFGEMGGLLR